MTIDDFIKKYNGQYVGDGQCGNLVRAYWNEVDHTVPPSYPNSRDYWFNPVPGYDKVQDPIPGAIAIYDGHTGYPEGHSAIYYDGRVFEQNANPDGSPAHLFPRPTLRLLGYLRKQGSEEPVVTWNNGDTYNLLYKSVSKEVADKAQAANYQGYFGLQDGMEYKKAMYDIINSDQYAFMIADAHQSPSGATTLQKGLYEVK